MAYLGAGALNPLHPLYSMGVLLGVLIFNRVEQTFIDTV